MLRKQSLHLGFLVRRLPWSRCALQDLSGIGCTRQNHSVIGVIRAVVVKQRLHTAGRHLEILPGKAHLGPCQGNAPEDSTINLMLQRVLSYRSS